MARAFVSFLEDEKSGDMLVCPWEWGNRETETGSAEKEMTIPGPQMKRASEKMKGGRMQSRRQGLAFVRVQIFLYRQRRCHWKVRLAGLLLPQFSAEKCENVGHTS